MPDLREHLQQFFGLDDFRPAQREVIEDVLRGKDVLCVMPTGAGKSLCYQLPAAIQGGLNIVVSPLISLMEDQVQQLRDEGIPAAFLNSSLSASMRRQTLQELAGGFDGLLYVAPERFGSVEFQELVGRLKPKLLAIDEAHCISQWGHDFRPDYHRLGEVRRQLGSPPCIALTATATEEVRNDVIRQLNLNEPTVVVTGFDRPNLSYQSRRIAKAAEKESELLDLVGREPGSAIVYCATRKAVEEVTGMLGRSIGGRAVLAYHAGMEQAVRSANQERFMNTPRAIAVATNAFGMGINKPDIRLVVHYNIPGTLEAYYQEAGRAGRDGQRSRCVILFSYQDRYTQEFFIEKIGEDNRDADPKIIDRLKDHATQKLDLMIRYAQTHRCRRKMILDYFGDEAEALECRCDVCRPDGDSGDAGPVVAAVMSEEAVTLVRQLLSAVARLHGRFGVGVVAEVLAGVDNEKAQRWGFNDLSVFGLLRAHSIKRIVAMLHRVMEAGLARQRDPEGVKFRPVMELTAAGIAVMKGQQPPPTSLADLLPRRGSNSSGSERRRAVSQQSIDGDFSPESQRRFERLRAIRAQLARERDLPAYCICHDTTLKLIAQAAPADADALEQVKGMGPHKVRMYGQAFLTALQQG
jgi:ATP-dependent DNA helicase RecQ